LLPESSERAIGNWAKLQRAARMGVAYERPSRPARPNRKFPRSELWQQSAHANAAASKKLYTLECGSTLFEGDDSVHDSDDSRSEREQPKHSELHAPPASQRPAETAAAREAYIEALRTLRAAGSTDFYIPTDNNSVLVPQWSLATDTAWAASAEELQCSSVATLLADERVQHDQNTAALQQQRPCELQSILLQQGSLASTATAAYGTAAEAAAAECDSDADSSSSSGSGDERSVTLASDKQRLAKHTPPAAAAWLLQSRTEGKQSLYERYHRDVTPSYTRSSDAVLGRDRGVNGSFADAHHCCRQL
jgi:hypothetical protein